MSNCACVLYVWSYYEQWIYYKKWNYPVGWSKFSYWTHFDNKFKHREYKHNCSFSNWRKAIILKKIKKQYIIVIVVNKGKGVVTLAKDEYMENNEEILTVKSKSKLFYQKTGQSIFYVWEQNK